MGISGCWLVGCVLASAFHVQACVTRSGNHMKICKAANLQIRTSVHLQIRTSAHLQICKSARAHIRTSAHLQSANLKNAQVLHRTLSPEDKERITAEGIETVVKYVASDGKRRCTGVAKALKASQCCSQRSHGACVDMVNT